MKASAKVLAAVGAVCAAGAAGVARAEYTFDIVARVGVELGDGVPLNFIVSDGGVALNESGEVAFMGRTPLDGAGNVVLTQHGAKARPGVALGDGTVAALIDQGGGVSINEAGVVAFKGRVGTFGGPDAVMTQGGVVKQAGGTLGDGTPLTFVFGLGTSGLNNSGKVVFTGRTDGSFNTAVLTQDGLKAHGGTVLADGTTVSLVLGGVSINDAGKAAFFGRTGAAGNPDAIMTQDGVVVQVGQALGDGRMLGFIAAAPTIVDSGDVVFIGRVDAFFGNTAVVTQHGVIVENGDVLPDGHTAFILEGGAGAKMNNGGLVAFGGRVGTLGGPDALFTQYERVVEIGGALEDGWTFNGLGGTVESNPNLAVNDAGQIAFIANIRKGSEFSQAVILATPVPEAGVAGVAGAAIVGGARRRRRGR